LRTYLLIKINSSAVFVSDTHLNDSSPETIAKFINFLEKNVSKYGCLFILGDLFDWWIGDDTNQFPQITTALKKLSKSMSIYFIAGNRDFFIGKEFEKKTGIQILKDPTLIQLGNKKTILLHGDTLCVDDKKYQKFRTIARSIIIKKIYLNLPLVLRQYIFKAVRKKSDEGKKSKNIEIMDVNQAAVENLFNEFNCPPLMIHGHTHRPKKHYYNFNNKHCERWVLNDWYDSESFLLWDKKKLKVVNI
jgi:UDP-2,3-diacylglucosamine hydrolase